MQCPPPPDPRLISVFETTLSHQQEVLSVFNVVIQTPSGVVSLVRYPLDFAEFHQKIRMHYPRSAKIPFPIFTEPSAYVHRLTRRRSLRNLFQMNKKSNADKVEKYLQRCFEHPVVSISTLLRDFLTVQREEDQVVQCDKSQAVPLCSDNKPIAAITSTIRQRSMPGQKLPEKSPPLPPVGPTPSTQPPPSTTTITTTTSDTVPTTTEADPPSMKHSAPSLDDFDLLKVLGKGCMGKVLLVRSQRDSQLYAMKVIKKNHVIKQNEVDHTKAERDILARMRGFSFLITLHYAFQTPTDLFLVLDYHCGGDIATQMATFPSFSAERTLFYAAEILQGLSILHQHGVIYRDLKPENVLIGHDGHIVLTDFGLSRIFNDDDDSSCYMSQTFCGTAEYLAPEVLLGESYTFTVDFWSLGTLLYEMLAGVTPFWADTHMDMYHRVLDDPLDFPSHFDQVTQDFLTGLLERDPTTRLGSDGAESVKMHPFFEGIDWLDVVQRKLEPPYIPKLHSETDLSNFDDTFVTTTPRISQSSSLDSSAIVDPFDRFSFDGSASTVSPPPLTSRMLRQKLQRARSKKVDNRFSTSSSLLSFSLAEIVRHTDTMPSFLTKNNTNNRYSRKRHSAHVVALKESEEQLQQQLQRPNSLYSSITHATADDDGFQSETSEHDRIQPPATAASTSAEPNHSPYTRPHCPVPGQARPATLSLASSFRTSSSTTSIHQHHHNNQLCLSDLSSEHSNTNTNSDWQQQPHFITS